MAQNDRWIEELLQILYAAGADLKKIDATTFQAGDQFFSFLSDEQKTKISKTAVRIHEDLFYTRKNQLVMRLKSLLGLNQSKIHGRSTGVETITKVRAKNFLDENHLMGFGGGKTFLGLIHKNQLVAVAVFSAPRFMKYENPPYYSTELERYCSLSDTTVTGGLDKLIKAFLKNYQTDDLVTTVDLEWSEGKSYLKLGFEKVSTTPSILFAVNKKTFQRRIILSTTELQKNEYVVKNLGNSKLRLRAAISAKESAVADD